MTTDLLLYTVTCITFFLLAFIAFFNPARLNLVANRWFGFFLFAAGCLLLNVIIYKAGAAVAYSRLIAFNELSRFAMAPALYLSVLHFTSPDKVVRKKEYLHFIPFGLFFIYMVPTLIAPGGNTFGHPALLTGLAGTLLRWLVAFTAKFQIVIYWILAYYRLNAHQQNIRLITANTSPVNLNWLRAMLLGIALMIFAGFSGLLLKLPFTPYTSLGYLIGALVICYFSLAQKEVYPFSKNELDEIGLVIKDEQESNKPKQRIPDEQLVQLKNKLIHLMAVGKPFLKSELGLPELAKKMDISAHHLSYVLNEGFGKNFFQFINTYRVEEAKQLMLSEKYRHLNLLGIGYQAGFNSKTTFNAAFKKETGVSPSQFMQQAKTKIAHSTSV